MSTLGYSERLSPYEAKGNCGAPEIFDSVRVVQNKIRKLVELFRQSNRIVFHTGAGISTSSRLPDFRGSKGVWTLEKHGRPLPADFVDFEHAVPSPTHMAIVALHRAGYISYVVTQNVDGLHLKSGLPREALAELHGNVFTEICTKCGREFVRDFDIKGCGLKPTGRSCSVCGAPLRDFLLDWEDELPQADLEKAESESEQADLCVCLGTSLQIIPSADIPFLCKKKSKAGKVVICNLQKTPRDGKADLIIHTYVDDVMRGLMSALGLAFPLHRSICRFNLLLDGDPAHSINNGVSNVNHLAKGSVLGFALEKPGDSMSIDSAGEQGNDTVNSMPIVAPTPLAPQTALSGGQQQEMEISKPIGTVASLSVAQAQQHSGLASLSIPVNVLARRGSFCVEALVPGQDAPDDPPPMVNPGQCDEVSLVVPPKPQNVVKRLAIQSLHGGPLVCVERAVHLGQPPSEEPMVTCGNPPVQYELLLDNEKREERVVRIYFDMPSRDIDALDITWREDADSQGQQVDTAPVITEQSLLPVSLAIGMPKTVEVVCRTVDYNPPNKRDNGGAELQDAKRSKMALA